MNILCIGDIVGRPGREAVDGLLPQLKKEFAVDLVIANGENSAGGAGITTRTAEQLFEFGCNVITTGDHVWDKSDIIELLGQNKNVLRPANFPQGAPGEGWGVFQTAEGQKIGVINLLGRVFMRYNVNCPFRQLTEIVDIIKQQTSIILVDIHAEATSEKVALGFFIDGKVSAVVGTHTHIQTADEKNFTERNRFYNRFGNDRAVSFRDWSK